jgi:site-specific DNA-cytosine methylase
VLPEDREFDNEWKAKVFQTGEKRVLQTFTPTSPTFFSFSLIGRLSTYYHYMYTGILRYFTPREVANLLGFPDEFHFPSDVKVNQQKVM